MPIYSSHPSFATLPAVTAASVRQLIQADGARYSAEGYRKCQDRLELGYRLIPEASTAQAQLAPGPCSIICPVPLFAAAVAQEQLTAGIADDLADLADGAE